MWKQEKKKRGCSAPNHIRAFKLKRSLPLVQWQNSASFFVFLSYKYNSSLVLPPFFHSTMNSSYHKSAANGYRHSDTRHQTRHTGDRYDAHRQSTARAHELDKDTQDSAYSSSSLLINRDNIVLSYPEKTVPAKEPVISLDIEDDEERIMQADWGNESDDDDAPTQKQHKRLSTVEREEIERTDRESKGVWVRHTADDGRLYYYNSVTRESVWEIPKNTTAATATITSTLPTNTKTEPASSSNSRPHKASSDSLGQPRSNSAPTASNGTTKEKQDTKIHVRARNDVSTSTNTNAEKGQMSNCTTKSTKTALQSSERRVSYTGREVSRESRSRLEISHSSHRSSRYTSSRRSRSRSPLPLPPPRDPYYDDYRYHHRSPSPPPYRHYPPYERYSDYHPYDDRIRYSPPPPLPPPDLRYRYYDQSPPPLLSPPPYYRSRERSWERYEAAHRSRYYR